MFEPTERTPGQFGQVACLLEATARKPGNVHRFRDFADCHYLDFALSALAIGPALDRARVDGVGLAILAAVRATRSTVNTNTNLGMILLLAPLAAVPDDRPLSQGIGPVLESTTIDDARHAFEAIRLANPGGLGTAPEQDVAGDPTVTLREAMSLAAERDSIARQYANNYADVLEIGVRSLANILARGYDPETAIVAAHLALLSQLPDSLIARKRGEGEANAASEFASDVLAAGWPDRAEGVRLCDEFDRWLRADGHARNPGTTADLVAASLFAALHEGVLTLPLSGDWGQGMGCGQ